GQRIASFFNETTSLDELSTGSQSKADILELDHLSDLLPYRIYDLDRKIYENKTSFGFFLELPPTLGMGSDAQQEISALINEIGEEGASIQCLMWADPRIEPFLENWAKPRQNKGGIFEKIAKKKQDFFAQQSETGDVPPRIFRFFFSYSVPKSSSKNQAYVLDQLSEKRAKTIATFSRFTPVFEPDPNDFLEILSGMLNFDKGIAVEKRREWNRDTFLSNQICIPGGSIEVFPDKLICGKQEDIQFKAYEAIDFPDHWSMHSMHELLGDYLNSSYRIPFPFFIHYGMYFPNQGKTETKFKSKAKILEHQFKFPSLVKMFQEMPREREEHLFTSKQLLEGEKFVETRLHVGLWGEKTQFLKAESILLSLYQKYGFKLKECHFHHLHDLLFALPMTWGESVPCMKDYKRRKLMRTTLTQETGNFIPFVGEWWGNSSTGMLLTGRRGQIATWDPFAAEGNLNAVVIGPSGSGKSVFMQEMIMNELGQGGRVFVLDLGRSFEKLCNLLDGQYLFFTESSKLNLNPFNLIKSEGDIENINLALEMTSSIIATMAMPSQKIDKERADILSSLVKLAWEKHGKNASVDNIIELIDETSYKSELMRGATESLKEGLKKFSKDGAYKDYFYGTSQINFNSDLVVIETEELKNMADLQAVILQIFALTISNEVFMGDREKRCLICIDEAWDLLKSPQMEGFIESMARRLRKYNGSLVVGTQGLKDFERSHGARAAFQNSNWLVMLGKDNDSINILKNENLIPMDDQKEKSLNSLRKEDGKYSEAFIYHKGSGFHTLNQLKLDPFSAMLYSTSAQDFQAIQELKICGIEVEEAVDWMIIHKEEFRQLLKNGHRIKEAVQKLFYRNARAIAEGKYEAPTHH
ncbi:MAG: type IV secretion system protein TraC, partial [Simkaniaceae bacterium]|nr:type IV secretion system protein TraC [Simkaniaceae bacterium]